MTDSTDSPDSVYVVQHDGAIHVMKSVASFPVDGSGSADDCAAANHLQGMVGAAAVTQVDRNKVNLANIIFVVPASTGH